MNILVAKHAGFCWGVRRAMDAALEASARFGDQGPVQTMGPLIHNPQALEHLSWRGVVEVDPTYEIQQGSVVVRAHGIPQEEWRQLKAHKRQGRLRLSNATCPEVSKVHALIKRYSAKGYFTIILGSEDHAEVIAHRSYASHGHAIVPNLEAAQALPDASLQQALVVAQTTFQVQDFHAIARHFKSRSQGILIKNTICSDTWERQDEARTVASSVDAVIVVGGHQSNNTKHLVEVARSLGKPVQHVESTADLDLEPLKACASIGVLSGASTPNWTVDEVVEALAQARQRRVFLRDLGQLSRILHLPLALGSGLLALALHHRWGWPTHVAGFLLPVTALVGLCALLPYQEPMGLGIKGQVREAFLNRHRKSIQTLGSLGILMALACAATMGLRVWVGTSLFVTLALFSPGLPRLKRSSGLKDLSQALAPALLAVGLPGLPFPVQHLGFWLAFLGVFLLALAAHTFRHLREFQEDRILGREILPVALGLKAARVVAVASSLWGVGLLVWVFLL